MHKLWASIYKELLLLSRDIGGLAILFVMPLVLVVTITLIQDSTFRSINDTKIPILWVDNDKGEVSKSIYDGLAESKSFTIIHKEYVREDKELTCKGKYQLAIVNQPHLSTALEQKLAINVEGLLSKSGLAEETTQPEQVDPEKNEVILYFDPATQMAFKNSIKT